ncbi:hypothetical protein HDU91_004624 [Kappamyces sp. JEL0680]|nr:hypothetical protein HDU91_004624 [Kappamyces sp. JEL0680]
MDTPPVQTIRGAAVSLPINVLSIVSTLAIIARLTRKKSRRNYLVVGSLVMNTFIQTVAILGMTLSVLPPHNHLLAYQCANLSNCFALFNAYFTLLLEVEILRTFSILDQRIRPRLLWQMQTVILGLFCICSVWNFANQFYYLTYGYRIPWLRNAAFAGNLAWGITWMTYDNAQLFYLTNLIKTSRERLDPVGRQKVIRDDEEAKYRSILQINFAACMLDLVTAVSFVGNFVIGNKNEYYDAVNMCVVGISGLHYITIILAFIKLGSLAIQSAPQTTGDFISTMPISSPGLAGIKSSKSDNTTLD